MCLWGIRKMLIPFVGLSLVCGCKIMESGKNGKESLIPGVVTTEGFKLRWEDPFETLNEKYWTVGLKDPISGDLVPGAAGQYLLNNQYDAYFTAENVYIDNGRLILRNQKERIQGSSPEGAFQYSSAWVMSMHKVFFREGYLEVKAQFPSGAKVWPAIWLIPEDLSWCPEWDLFEYFGYRNDLGFDQMGMHLCHTSWPDQQWKSYFIPGFDTKYDCEAWHIYGFAWTSSYAVWYIDGKEVRRLSSAGIPDWPSQNMYIVLNNGTRTESPEGDTPWPNYLSIDYIRLFTK